MTPVDKVSYFAKSDLPRVPGKRDKIERAMTSGTAKRAEQEWSVPCCVCGKAMTMMTSGFWGSDPEKDDNYCRGCEMEYNRTHGSATLEARIADLEAEVARLKNHDHEIHKAVAGMPECVSVGVTEPPGYPTTRPQAAKASAVGKPLCREQCSWPAR